MSPDQRAQPRIEIRVDGRLALTTAQVAERYGLKPASARKEIQRLGLAPAADLDSRTPLYDVEAVERAFGARPGRGVRRVHPNG